MREKERGRERERGSEGGGEGRGTRNIVVLCLYREI